jgi:cytochrome c-type biogenesis protein CcmH/NrfF
MSYTQQAILRDKNGDAIPQIWDVTQNKFVPYTNNDIKLLQNELALVKAELQAIKANQLSGDQKVTLKDASGAVVSPATEAKLEQVRALLSGVATENKLEQARTLLEAISTKDFATQTTLAAVLAKLADLESELATIKANQLSGDQKVQLSGTMTERYGADVNSRPPADTVLAGTTFTIVDESGYFQTWISDGTTWVEV